MSNVVMTGRRMNSPVRLIAAAALPTAAAVAAALRRRRHRPASAATRRRRPYHRAPPRSAHRRVRREARLPVGHDAIAFANAARDDRQAAGRALDDDRALPRGVRLIDDVHVRAALARHDRLRRHDERAFLIEQMQRGRRELARPQAAVAVVERRLELHGRGRSCRPRCR